MDTSRDAIPLIEGCLARLPEDPSAWNDLISYAFDRLQDQCKAILNQELSQPNPLITENSVLAATYFRLHKALQNEKVRPTTAREFFGLAARNIRWQIQDMVRRPSHRQEDQDRLEQYRDRSSPAGEVLEREKWQLFYEAVETLSPEEREIFDLIRINGLSQYEAAEVTGLTRNQIDSIWRRIKAKLADYCRRDG